MTSNEKKATARERFSRNLKAQRLEKGISQEELAARANITQTFLSQVESGKRNLSMDTADRLAAGLSLDILDLLQQ
jgi:transcriptional regulator with XRE-family HTH domain